MFRKERQHKWTVLFFLGFSLIFCSSWAAADVIINVLAVNGSDKQVEKDIQFSLPAEIKPDDIVDPAGLQIDYNINDAGYYLHGKVLLQGKESKTLKVKVKDVWSVTPEKVAAIKAEIDQGFNEMGSERSKQNGEALKKKLSDQLDYILAEQSQVTGGIDARIDAYRNHAQALQDVGTKAHLIDFWRTDSNEPEVTKTVAFKVEVTNPTDKPKKIKQQHYLPQEVRPEYIVDRKGYEIRFDDKKVTSFLFKEEDLQPKEKKEVAFSIKDMWFVPSKDMGYIRERSQYIEDTMKRSKFAQTASDLYKGIINNLDLIDALQSEEQPDIKQHIGAYRLNAKRFAKAKEDLDSLEKLLSRHRADLEKSKIKNVMQKMQSMKTLARVSQAIFDKKPTVNAAWKIIGSVMIFLGLFTIIHFVTWFLRSSREKKQEEIRVKELANEGDEPKA